MHLSILTENCAKFNFIGVLCENKKGKLEKLKLFQEMYIRISFINLQSSSRENKSDGMSTA